MTQDREGRLREALEQAAQAKAQALEDQPWSTLCDVYASEGGVVAVPTPAASELMGRRMAFDMLASSGTAEDVHRVFYEYVSIVGSPAYVLPVVTGALMVLAIEICQAMIGELENKSDPDQRIHLADAARIAWSLRLEGGSV